jgi:hypothetical protein
LSFLVASQTVEVWPENWQTVNLFTQVATQWRVGMGGPIGLDYNVLFRLLDMADLSKEDWEQSFEEVRVMEAAALEAMRQD